MKGPAVGAVVSALLLSGAGCGAGNGSLRSFGDQPTKPDEVSVELIVDTKEAQEARCSKQPVDPKTVLVINFVPHHCIGKKLVPHSDNESEQAAVRVSRGQKVRWFSSTTEFKVAKVMPEGKQLAGAPDSPFDGNLPADPAKQIVSPPVRDLGGKVVQRYKVIFEIDGMPVDPDLICTM